MDSITQRLKSVYLFRGLSPAQLERLGGITRAARYDVGDVIFRQNDPGDHLYVITQGQVQVQVTGDDGAPHAAVFLGTGQVFGEMALLDQGPRSATVIAAQPDTEVCALAQADLAALFEADTGLGFVMMRNLALDLSFKIRHQNFSL
jgi:CRP-like cAMP-binding protein